MSEYETRQFFGIENKPILSEKYIKYQKEIDDQNGAFAQMYKKDKNMDIFDFIAMFSEKYEIFKNR